MVVMKNLFSPFRATFALALVPLFWQVQMAFAQGTPNPSAVATPTANTAAGQSSDTASTSADTSIPVGTVITTANWRKYQQFMPDGTVILFEGKTDWKMPDDVSMTVGPTVINPLPSGYRAATAKYSPATKLVELPGGGLTIGGYQGGMPFPNPIEPHRGWKILVYFWYRYIPHIVVNAPDNRGFNCTVDSVGDINCVKGLWIARQLSYNTDPDTPATFTGARGKYYTTWFMIEEPEQQHYTTTLTIEYTDMTKPEDVFTFVPAMRRTQRMSAAARCSTSGSETTADDGRFGFDGTIPDFSAELIASRKILTELDIKSAGANFPGNYDMPLGWPKPSWRQWVLAATPQDRFRRLER
jgi:hypothetical protein